jgi:predicted nucleic acid-binding protein
MSTLIYIETSIPSFYHETRPERDLQSRRDWTRQWWAMPKFDQELVISLPVISELEATPQPKRNKALALISQLRLLPYAPEIADIVEVYFAHKLMPLEAQGDADHLALASFHNCDMLVTWNCKHLANANKFGHIHRVNALLGLRTPALVTPLQLVEKHDESET